MEQIYIDSLKALMVYKYDLDAVVLELERVEQQNAVLYFVLGAVVVLAAAVGYLFIGDTAGRSIQKNLPTVCSPVRLGTCLRLQKR